MLLEILINIIHPLPYVDYKFTMKVMGTKINYHLETFLYAMMFFKLYNVIKITSSFSGYSDNLSNSICDQYGIDAGSIFALKSIQNDNPFVILIFFFGLICITLGLLLRMFEMYKLLIKFAHLR